jgi:hypothetical protein
VQFCHLVTVSALISLVINVTLFVLKFCTATAVVDQARQTFAFGCCLWHGDSAGARVHQYEKDGRQRPLIYFSDAMPETEFVPSSEKGRREE